MHIYNSILFWQLFSGQLGNFATRSGLKVTHLQELADYAITLKMFSQAVDLFDGIIKSCGLAIQEEFRECSGINSTDLNLQLDKAIKMVNKFH